MCTLRQSLFLKFVDKTLLGVIAITAAFFYNRYLEDYRKRPTGDPLPGSVAV